VSAWFADNPNPLTKKDAAVEAIVFDLRRGLVVPVYGIFCLLSLLGRTRS